MSPAARIPRRRRITAALALAGLTVTASGCTVANSGHGGYDADTLRIVISQEPPTLEPCESSLTSTGIVVRSNITEPLIERDPNSGELTPLLSTGWRQTSPTEWTFDIREGVTFSDGSPFTAQDAAFAIDRAVNSDLQCNVDGYVFGDEKLELATPNDTTLTVTTTEPDPILPLRISFVEIVPRSTSTTEKVREPIGTGPYAIEDWEYGQKLLLKRNDTYWGKEPAFARAEYQWRSEGSVRAAMITNDETDIATSLGPEDGAGDLGVPFQNNETTALRMQATEAPLNDIRVRQAINYAVNREGIVKALFRGLGQPAAQLIPSGVVGYNDATAAVAARHREGQAADRRGEGRRRPGRQADPAHRPHRPVPQHQRDDRGAAERVRRDRAQRQDRDDGHVQPAAVPAAAVPGGHRALPADDPARQPGR